MRRTMLGIALLASASMANSQTVKLDAGRPGTPVLSGAPERALTEARSLMSERRPDAQPISIADLYFLRSSGYATWTPDGRDIVMATDLTGRSNLWRTSSTGGFPQQLQQSEDKVAYPAVSPDGKTVLYASDVGGREIYDVFSVPFDGGPQINLTASQDASEVGPFIFSRDGRTVAMQRRMAAKGSTDIALLTLAGRTLRNLTGEEGAGISWSTIAFTPDGKSVIANRQNRTSTEANIWLIDIATGTKRRLIETAKSFDIGIALSPDGRLLSATSENEAGIRQAVLIDIATGAHTAMSPSSWPQEGGAISPDGKTALALTNVDGSDEVTLYDIARRTVRKLDLPRGTNSGYSGALPAFSPDGRRLLFPNSSASAPFDYWTFDLVTGKAARMTNLGLAGVKADALPRSRTVTYKSADGTPVSAVLWMPYNLERDGSAPVVVMAHGGPSGQTMNRFNPTAVALASRGYIVIAPNVRGSTGYGRAFQEANRRDLGGRDLEDEAWAAKFLVASGYADPKKLGITGGSYGGFMTLMAVSRMPDFWAAGVAGYGIVNWRSMWERGSPALLEYQRGLIGDPAIDKDVYDRTSPLSYFSQVKAPLLVLQGENDIRVPKGEAEQVVDILTKAGKTVDVRYYPEEGHGFQKRENQIDALQRTVDWFDRHLSGRR